MSLGDKLRKAMGQRPTWKRRPEVLLCPQIPKPMHGLAPREIKGPKWWNETRRAAYKATAYHCLACGVYKHDAQGRRWLEGHEIYEVDYLLGRMTYVECVALCHYCHNSIHGGRLRALLEKGFVHQAKYAAIIQHRDRVLAEAGLVLPEPYSGPTADWSDWRLVLDGKEYKPLFATFEEWVRFFS